MSPNCSKCIHFFVTWDKNAPRGCHAYGFKTEGIPSTVVEQTTQIPCQAMELKTGLTKRDTCTPHNQ